MNPTTGGWLFLFPSFFMPPFSIALKGGAKRSRLRNRFAYAAGQTYYLPNRKIEIVERIHLVLESEGAVFRFAFLQSIIRNNNAEKGA
jgi:hypothetical protein